jgi:hypothetical protein
VAVSLIDLDELVEHWTVLEDERTLVDAKRGAARLGFALLLKFYTRHGRFPIGGSELPGEVVEYVARQVEVASADVRSYEWVGRSIERHRAQIREHLGFRECTVTDAEQLTAWLAEHVAQAERRPALVRDELLARCRSERIEPPAPGRVDRVVRSALRAGEETLCSRVSARLGDKSRERITALVAVDDGEDAIATDCAVESDHGDRGERLVLGKLKEAAGSVSLETMLTEIEKLLAVRAIGVSPGVFTALVYVNTLMLQDILDEPAWAEMLTPADRRGLTPLFWMHVLPYGEVNLDMTSRLNLAQPATSTLAATG